MYGSAVVTMATLAIGGNGSKLACCSWSAGTVRAQRAVRPITCASTGVSSANEQWEERTRERRRTFTGETGLEARCLPSKSRHTWANYKPIQRKWERP